MYNINRQPIHKVKRRIYIASKLENIIDNYGNEIKNYSTPQKYYFNVQTQTTKTSSDYQDFGQEISEMLSVTITEKQKYDNKFKDFDLVYVYTNPNGEPVNGANADYRIKSVIPQNTCIKLLLVRLTTSYTDD
jgi:hypothetical protein